MTDQNLVTIEQVGHVATVTIQRPEKMNALNAAVIAELKSAFATLCASGEVRCAVLTGAGKAFVAGADIAAMQAMSTVEAKRFSDEGQVMMASIEEAPFPVIAAVNGFALGGGLELALACDFIYAAENAKLGQPEVSLGVIPGFGGTARLSRRVGIAKARELVFTGDMITAEQSLAIGLVNQVTPKGEVVAKAQEVALKIASKGPIAVCAAKRVLLRGEGASLGAACELEAQAFGALFGSEDQKTGMQAFLDKATAVFTGR